MFANNHHGDGYVAVWLPAPPGLQAGLISNLAGGLGIELIRISDEDLKFHIDMP